MQNYPRLCQLHGDVHHTADHPLDWQMRGDHPARIHRSQGAPLKLAAMPVKVPPGDTILDNHNGAIRATQGSQLRGKQGQAVGLDSNDHHILPPQLSQVVAGRQPLYPSHRGIPLPDQLQALAADGLQVGSPRHHTD
ncbi:hypothetical protein SYN65AY6A5_13325 [Synechococcus sp. 65AY6A5]|nr:hypothetical protein SYN65AY6A5_13325 [Synechococcus sp. 65AY6A5]